MALTLSPSNASSRALTPSSTMPIANAPTANAPRSRLSITDLIGSNEPRHTTSSASASKHQASGEGPSPTRTAARAAAVALTAGTTVAAAVEDDNDNDKQTDANMENTDTASSGTTKQPARKSRVLRRKTDHSVIERRRREKINERLIRLQEMVPACREEVMEMLDKKTLKRGGGAAKGKGATLTDEGERKAEMERKCSEEMVLEKLCIISHTVDYVTELRNQVAAYRRLCQCDPPVGEPAPRDPTMHHRFAHELQGGLEEGATSARADARSQSPTTTTTATGASSSQSPDIEATSSTIAPKRKRHWGSNRPVKADPPTKKKQRGSTGTATPAATKTTRAAARAIAAGASKAGSPQDEGAEGSGEEDSAAGSDEEEEEDDYDDEAFEMDDHIGEPNESRAAAIQSAYQPHGVAFESTHIATSPSGKRRFSDPVRLRNGTLQQQQQHHQQQQQQAMLSRSALPNSYMRGGHPAAMMMGYAPMSAPPWHQHQHSGPAMQTLPAMRPAMSSMDTRAYDGGASQHAPGHGAGTASSSNEQEAQSHRRLQLLATVSAVSQ